VIGQIKEAVFSRMNGDSTLRTEVGVGADSAINAFPQFPGDVLDDESAFPCLSYLVITDVPVGSIDDAMIQVDQFVWKDGANGGEAKARAIEAQLDVLFHETWWTVNGLRVWSYRTDASERPTSEHEPFHWMREYAIRMS
jgi:hypothetical protein